MKRAGGEARRAAPLAPLDRSGSSAAPRAPLDPLRSTRALLKLLLGATVAVTLLACGALLLSYEKVRTGPEQMRATLSPTIQKIAATRAALENTQQDVCDGDAGGRACDPQLLKLIGAGEEYRTQLSAADQNLSQLSLDDEDDRNAIATVNGLLTVYSDRVAQATGPYADNAAMREQKWAEARSILTRAQIGILPRLEKVQQKETQRMTDRTDDGPVQTAGWWAAEAGLAVLVLLLAAAWWVLVRRCGRRANPWLAAGMLLAVLLGVLAWGWAHDTQRHVESAGGELRQLQVRASEAAITENAGRVRDELTATEPAAARLPWLVAGCVGLLVLPATGLWWRLYADYSRGADQ